MRMSVGFLLVERTDAARPNRAPTVATADTAATVKNDLRVGRAAWLIIPECYAIADERNKKSCSARATDPIDVSLLHVSGFRLNVGIRNPQLTCNRLTPWDPPAATGRQCESPRPWRSPGNRRGRRLGRRGR